MRTRNRHPVLALLSLRSCFFKNRLRNNIRLGNWLCGETVLPAATFLLTVALFFLYQATLRLLLKKQELGLSAIGNVVSATLFLASILLSFSSIGSALWNFFASKDLQLLLSLPVRKRDLFLARLFESMLAASWVGLIFLIPALLALKVTLGFPWMFCLLGLSGAFFLAMIAADIGVIGAVLLMSFISPGRLGHFCLWVGSIVACLFLAGGVELQISGGAEPSLVQSLLKNLVTNETTLPWWCPSEMLSDIFRSYLYRNWDPLVPWSALLCVTVLATTLTYFIWAKLFFRVWAQVSEHGRAPILRTGIRWAVLGESSPGRALIQKERRMFLRDPTQILQLALILLLTMLYLYNFRILRDVSLHTPEAAMWWQMILSLANLSMGACVGAALAARFVFPSISSEGQAYAILRTTPVSLREILRAKFAAWTWPLALVTTTLVISGAFATQSPPALVLTSGILACAASIGVSGLGIGLGAVYARFDWDNISQITSSFGGLMFMFLSFIVVMITLVPASCLFFVLSVAADDPQLSRGEKMISAAVMLGIAFLINGLIAIAALRAGEERLREMEQ